MAGNWTWVPFTALVCCLYLLLSLLAAKKNRAIYSFIILLCTMTCWTEGSLMMRLQSWPGFTFWFHLSVTSLLLMVCSFYYCVGVLLEIEKLPRLVLWYTMILAASILNALSGCFLSPPELRILQGGEAAFFYISSPGTAFLFLLCMLIIADTIIMFLKSRADRKTKRQMKPLFFGFFVLAAGHLAIWLPVFAGFPLDILSGILNALCLFYTIRKKRLVRLNLLFSRNSCYLAATVMILLALFNWLQEIETWIQMIFPNVKENMTVLLSALTAVVTLLTYQMARMIIDRMFVRDVTVRAEKLKEFCLRVSQTFKEAEILEHTFRIIEGNMPADHIFACMEKQDGYLVYDNKAGSKRTKDFPSGRLLAYLRQNPGFMAPREQEQVERWKEMSEEERQLLKKYKIACLVSPGNNYFFGFLAITSRAGVDFGYEETAFLESVESIASMALSNSQLYEKARIEARTDMMTGLLNRRAFYEKLNEKCTEKQAAFSLVLLNLDDFKLFNQLYGVSNGDGAICSIANLLTEMLGEDSVVARYGGKEFAVILPSVPSEEAKSLIKEFLRRMNRLKTGNGKKELNILTASCGICSFPDEADTSEKLLSCAELAVYHVKQHGKNDVMVYQELGNIQEDKEKQDIYSSYASTIFALTAAIDTKDHYTFNHSQNVAYYAKGLARLLNRNDDFVEVVREAALLHDIGKIGIPEAILNKPGRLTEEEYKIMQNHVENSIGIIRHLPSLNYVIPAVICHHERYDGKGYPRRVAGKDIPLSGRILCIADSFDAMVSRRTYKEPFPLEKAISIIREERGAQFDPKLADIFIEGIKMGKIKVQ